VKKQEQFEKGVMPFCFEFGLGKTIKKLDWGNNAQQKWGKR
jgi:hypothetical protein